MGFINEACSVSETINFSKGVWRLFHTELKVEWSEVKRSLETKGIDIVSSKPDTSKPYVVIRGETRAVQEAKEDILSHQVSVESKKIILSQAGVYSYFLSNNALILKGIENAAGVCIEVEVKGMSPNVFKEVFTGVTKEMMSVCVVVGDLTEFNQAEVIVNAANEELKHKGGIAAAIARKGGPSIQQESNDYIRKNKKVATGTAVHFTATGNLPSSFKAIVHAVGPRYHAEDKQNSCATLKQAIFQSLELAKNYESVAFPAIGGGNFGFPIAVCANIHFEAVVEFSKTEQPTKLRKVYFVIIEENVEVFLQVAKNYLSDILLEQPPTFESLRPLSVPHLAPNASSASSVLPTLTTIAAQQYPKRKTKKHKPSYSVPELGTSLEYIKISQGSIIDYPEEALVNTTDENLKLEGYVSKVLLKEAGPDLKKECDALTKPFKTGSVVATKAYKLRNSKHVLHVILPNYDRKSEGVLREVVRNCLDECTRLKVKSLSMPSIGAGNLKYPPDIVARVLIEETVSFFQKNNGKTTLKLVHFVIYEQDIFEKFQKVLRLGQQSPRATNFDSKSMQSLLITKGSVTDFQEEAVVFTNNPNLELKGVVGQVLTKHAGPELKKECDALKKPIEFGSVIATKGHSLKAKYILHAILQSRGTSSEEPEKVLRKIAVKCLDECTRLKVKSLSMTSIGAGKLGYPNDIVAKALLEETAIYLKKNKGNTTIELVRFVIYEQTVYDEFNKVYQQLNAVATKRKEFSLSQSHPLKLELLEGEIGNDSSDVTVTYDAAASLVEKKPLMKLIQNSGGVGRKMTLPVAFHQSTHEQKKFSFACLDKAEKDQFESIVFPAQFQSHAIVPKAIVDASQKFVATNPIHMKVIRVLYTTLSPEIVQHYEEALKSWTNGQESGFLSKAKAFRSAVASAVGYSHESRSYFKDTPTLEFEVVLDIFGKTNEAILKAEQQIRETVKENFIDLKIEDKHIAALSAEGLHEISSIAASSNVKIDIDQERGIITFRGFQDVHKVRSDIQNILQKISEAEVQQTLADTLYQSIRWVQMPSSGNEEEYDEILNYEIEQAYQREEKEFLSTDHNFVIDFTKMTDRDLTTNATARVKRIKIDVPLPEIWSPMPLDQGKEKFFHLVQLPPTSPEYIGVERAFTQTMNRGQQYTEILSIERIQIPALYKQYALAKKEMDMRNPVGHINERHLWHGTNHETIEKINTQGFNRSFAGKHATAFGKGVYFATNSAYSHKYADPGVNKHRYMFYVQVLTGEYTRGDTNTIVPPMKPNQQNPAVLYDSTVNDINNPTIFVVYKDTQNYPAYLVQYR
ncbi:PREDICTED: poly [ADP-ribose] polymerase 14-like [Amphimedon queenslandica]|uniref:Poly [ADP-ribose] polymerase n=1 Tax=Amphimedon queenslandica TaxID=400682 RepID=A0A1X7UZU5_AMPQE|nr:PREDICTED: poly [ADP-ribose] polymerase 14-like [Amphimedon queenslandica]|eukprot:XP_019851552.1 PREDICTED: poly [ADP-ribose] polymerase 14-like [Amphimedon queenslandica]